MSDVWIPGTISLTREQQLELQRNDLVKEVEALKAKLANVTATLSLLQVDHRVTVERLDVSHLAKDAILQQLTTVTVERDALSELVLELRAKLAEHL